jgi:hypothetical protein
LPATLDHLANERLVVQGRFRSGADAAEDQELTLPMTALSVLWSSLPENLAGDEAGPFLRRLAAEQRRHDVVYLLNGDMLEGTLTTLNKEEVRLEGENGKAIKVERSKLAVLALSTELVRTLRPRTSYARLVLTNGCRISLSSAHSAGLTLIGKTLFGATVQIPLDEVAALDTRQGKAVYLSDLKARRYEHTPYLGVRYSYTLDSTVAGHDLRPDGSTYDKGLGLHSASRLTYDLQGGYQWFESLVGLDEKTGRHGSVQIQVLVDGKPQDLGKDQELTSRDKPHAVRVRVAGAKELTLVVDFGGHGNVQDHVDWVDARLIK